MRFVVVEEVDLNKLEMGEIDLHLPRRVDNLERIAVLLIFSCPTLKFQCFSK